MGTNTPASFYPVYTDDLLVDRFINSSKTIVSDVLSGLVNANPNVGILNYGKVVICRDYSAQDIVKIVSGGGSGHEPSHAEYVGTGFLTAAVQGEIFRSPFVSEIINTIKELSYKLIAGVLVIIQNNTSDRLNFSLAVERARNQGIEVKLFVVTDEFCVINPHQGKRGLSGIVLINKIAGALAKKETSLDETYKYCKLVNDNMSTILFSLKPSSATAVQECICVKKMKEFEIEIGTGLHGEEGTLRIEKSSVKNTCSVVLDKLIQHFPLNPGQVVVVMINNLGTALKIEELTVVNEVVHYINQLQLQIARLYYGKYLTSLDMEGFSITILRVFNDTVLQHLDEYCEAIAWGYVNKKPITLNLEDRLVCRVSKRKRVAVGGPSLSNAEANIVFHVVQFACDALISCEKQLNVIDADGGAGNVGTKMKRGSQFVLSQMQTNTIDFSRPRKIFETLSEISEKKIGGGIGSLYAIFFEAGSNYFRRVFENDRVTSNTWLNALENANKAMQCYGNIELGLGTMYDPLNACAETLKTLLNTDVKPLKAFGDAVGAAETAVLRTKVKCRKYVDPGAQAVGIWMRAVYEGLQLRFDSELFYPTLHTITAMDFDDMLVELGELGRFQIVTYVLVCLPVLFGAINSLTYVFTAGVPKYRCVIPGCDYLPNPVYNASWLEWAIPNGDVHNLEYKPEYCERYVRKENATTNVCSPNLFSTEIERCNEWVFDEERTIVNDWNITCLENQWMLSLVGTFHFAGIIVGSAAFGALADRVIQIFSPNYIVFNIFVFINALGTAGIYPLAFIIGVEMVGRRKREVTGMILNYFYAIGEAFVALIAWLTKDWVHVQVIASAPAIVFIKKDKEAENIVCRVAKVNKVTLSDSFMDNFKKDENLTVKKIKREPQILPMIRKMMKSRKLIVRFVIVFYIWAVNAFIFYGLSINATSIGGDKYLNFALVSLIEIPGITLAWICIQKLGRRLSLVGSHLICGITCCLTVFVPPGVLWATVVLFLIGKLGVTSAFTISYVYTSEMLPTLIRSGGVGAASTCARFGALLAPFVPLLGNYLHYLPMLLFGIVAITAGLLGLKLPETLGIKLPETVLDAQRL
ncbi:hypothetical protein RN001_007175 [Aquatica leii]|uniref:Triokinase/FMN cyclase n=1 Tax=Aquatica leii TaxID=1421715 RepID=A0AAN7SGQ0_9COLE|nr:hypothetical protein RN001_007175 [Aquatica leii]